MNEQQHLEEVIGRFLQNTRENEEISKEEAIYLKRRVRPAMEYLIVQENIDGMKKMADRGWFGEQELNGFLTRAGELKKWDAFRVLLAWKNHISTKEKISEYSDETGADHRPDETLQKMSYAGVSGAWQGAAGAPDAAG